MQPGCTGRIADGYCDVCGGPVGAVPFVPAAASAAAPVPADAPGLTAVRQVPGFPPKPKSESLMMGCPQPRCMGMIVDGYCDVCGSPAGAVPLVPAAASAASPVPADEPGSTVVPALTPSPANPGAVDAQRVGTEKVGPAADDTGKVDQRKELAEGEPDGAQDYRTRVQEAHLPDDVPEAALGDVDKLEPISDQAPESGDIPTWLDTMHDLPGSTNTTDWIDIQGSREVEATLRRLIEPAAADLEEGNTGEAAAADLEKSDTAEVEPAAADLAEGDTAEVEPAAVDLADGDTAEVEPAAVDLEEGDAAPAGPQHDDTVKMPAVPAVLNGGRQQPPQLPKQPVLSPEPVQTPAKKRRFGYLALAATALAALLIGALLFATSRDGGVTAQSVPTVAATATATVTKPTSEPSNQSTDTGGEESNIQLEVLADSARPFQPVRIEGRYRGGADTFLRVQRWEGGEWLDFPVPTKANSSGQFTAFVELGQPGRYRLRVLEPGSGVASKPFVLVIKG
jgi:hypothetical protein